MDNKKNGIQKNERLGEIKINNQGCKMKIIEYNKYSDIIIEFQDEYKAKIKAEYGQFQDGRIKNPYFPSVFDVGYIGQGKYSYKMHKKIYQVWKEMLQRCYYPYYINKYPSYIDCYVCEEWHNFQNFAKWYEENYYEIERQRMELDKDILFKGNKIYSPSTCVFVPQRINYLFIKSKSIRGNYPIGVSYHKTSDKLSVTCNTFNKGDKKPKQIYLGLFNKNKPFQAFTTYKQFKEGHIKQVADEYKDLIPKRLYEAMCKYEVEIND